MKRFRILKDLIYSDISFLYGFIKVDHLAFSITKLG